MNPQENLEDFFMSFHSDKNLIILTGFFALKFQLRLNNKLILNNLN